MAAVSLARASRISPPGFRGTKVAQGAFLVRHDHHHHHHYLVKVRRGNFEIPARWVRASCSASELTAHAAFTASFHYNDLMKRDDSLLPKWQPAAALATWPQVSFLVIFCESVARHDPQILYLTVAALTLVTLRLT